jgi:endoglycosylceramidase
VGLVLLAVTLVTTATASSVSASVPAGSNGTDIKGPIRADDGPYLRDQYGRVVVLHGVNVVYKRSPYDLSLDPDALNAFTAGDAERIADLGFNVVRLGIIWAGLEPGSATLNDPSICTPGTPGDPSQLNLPVLMAYLAQVKKTVDLLGSYHIDTLLDMHQDLYSSAFGGEGAPAWAVCTDGLSTAMNPGRWSHTYSSPALKVAFDHFWNNDVIGDLQGEYDRVWGLVAAYFKDTPTILGYDPMNEPYSPSYIPAGHQELDPLIECFYTGTLHPGQSSTGQTIACPRNDPAEGVIPTIEAADPNHPVFFEPDIFTMRGGTNFLGAMDLPNLVFNFHSYCPQRSGVTGNPTDPDVCADHVVTTIDRRQDDRSQMASPAQPAGPALFLSEFGATSNLPLLEQVGSVTQGNFLSWTYWQWRYYDDPTGSADEALVDADGQLKSSALALDQAYAQAIAGTPVSTNFDPVTDRFTLNYVPDWRITAPTVIFMPMLDYPQGYCVQAQGATVTSPPDQGHLTLTNQIGGPHLVSIAVNRCTS